MQWDGRPSRFKWLLDTSTLAHRCRYGWGRPSHCIQIAAVEGLAGARVPDLTRFREVTKRQHLEPRPIDPSMLLNWHVCPITRQQVIGLLGSATTRRKIRIESRPREPPRNPQHAASRPPLRQRRLAGGKGVG